MAGGEHTNTSTPPDAQTIDFGAGLEWTKFPATVLDDVFADPNFWPFV